MSLGWPIHSVSSKKEFWTDYFWESEIGPTGEGYVQLVNHEEPVSEEDAAQLRRYNIRRSKWHHCRLDVPLGENLLRLQFDPLLSAVYLFLSERSGKAIELGWDDQAHWHPHVLRCEELDLFCRCIARQDTSLPHPGVPLLLLCRFAPVTDSEDSERALFLLREAWHSLGLFTHDQIRKFLRSVDYRGTGVAWRQDNHQRWILHLDRDLHPDVGLYTLRCQENPDFPFDQLGAALQTARQLLV
jgi:hypothetical protein